MKKKDKYDRIIAKLRIFGEVMSIDKEIKEKWKQEIRKGNISPCRCSGKSLAFAEAYKEVIEEDLGIKKDEHKE